MTKTFIYNKNLEIMYSEEAFKKEYLDPSEWDADVEEWFNDYCNECHLSFSDIFALDEEEKKELCEEFLAWFLDEYEDGTDLIVCREICYKE